MKPRDLLERKYLNIMSQSVTDIGRNNLIELDIPMEGLLIVSKPYTVPLKYCEFVDHKIKGKHHLTKYEQLGQPDISGAQEARHMDSNNTQGISNFNMQLCIDYRKLNSCIQTAHQIKANGTLDKVISNYPLPTINNILAHFNGCKYFLTINLRSGYNCIKLIKEAAEKMAFITDKGEWIFHLLPFGINIGLSAFSCVLGKVLVQCSEYALKYLGDITVFSEMWESHLIHFEEVFKWLKDADLKIKCSKCEFFKSKAHYLGYLVGANGVQPLQEKAQP